MLDNSRFRVALLFDGGSIEQLERITFSPVLILIWEVRRVHVSDDGRDFEERLTTEYFAEKLVYRCVLTNPLSRVVVAVLAERFGNRFRY